VIKTTATVSRNLHDSVSSIITTLKSAHVLTLETPPEAQVSLWFDMTEIGAAYEGFQEAPIFRGVVDVIEVCLQASDTVYSEGVRRPSEQLADRHAHMSYIKLRAKPMSAAPMVLSSGNREGMLARSEAYAVHLVGSYSNETWL
jgi:hypothetical protein